MNKALVGYGRLAMLVDQADKGVPSLLKAVMVNQARGMTLIRVRAFLRISRDYFYSLVRRTKFGVFYFCFCALCRCVCVWLYKSHYVMFNKTPASELN